MTFATTVLHRLRIVRPLLAATLAALAAVVFGYLLVHQHLADPAQPIGKQTPAVTATP